MLLLAGIMAPTIGTAKAQTSSVYQVQSGLVAHDSLTTGDTSYWTFWSSTINTPVLKDYYEDSEGLHIGVQAPYHPWGKWVNYAAVSPDTNADLFHAVITNSYASVPDGVFEAGLYVVAPNSNYVGCIAVADFDEHYWAVHQAYGSQIIGSGTITTLYESPLNTMPLIQDCTIITNGDNYLKVYLGGDLVFSSDTMDMKMPAPFKALLQVDATSPTMHYGTFTDYYATSSEEVTVTDAPSSGTVQIVDPSSAVLASASVGSDGTATMPVGMYGLPLNAYINVYNSTNALVANTTSAITIWGGDMYTTNEPVPPPPPQEGNSIISVTTVDSNGNELSGFYVTLWQDGAMLEDCHSPCSFTVNNVRTYQVAVADYGLYAFDHWSDGTTNRYHDVTTGNNTTTDLVAVYRKVL